jgi:transcriptional regulator with XRE-family HTH domain
MYDAIWLGERLRMLRARSGLSIRQLAKASSVSVAMVSYVERGAQSPSMVTLQKLLEALGSSLPEFFAEGTVPEGSIFLREQMGVASDADRTYAMLFGPRPDIHLEMTDEHIRPGVEKPEFATLVGDIAGYILSGRLVFEIVGEVETVLRPGDAFYVKAGTSHRGYAEDEEVRLMTTILRSTASTTSSARDEEATNARPIGSKAAPAFAR